MKNIIMFSIFTIPFISLCSLDEDIDFNLEKEKKKILVARKKEAYGKYQDDDDDKNSSPVLIKPIAPIKEENK